MPGWAVAICQPGGEAKAIFNCTRQGFEIFVPKLRVKKFGWRGRKVVRDEWLFARYFFVWIDGQWHSLLGTIGVSGVIKNGEAPALLSETVIDAVRARCDRDGYFIPTTVSKFKIGERVRVAGDGAYHGHIAIYQGMKPGDRADALVQFMGAWVHASIKEGDLTAV
jgi:transcriptional antiterminator RfaH